MLCMLDKFVGAVNKDGFLGKLFLFTVIFGVDASLFTFELNKVLISKMHMSDKFMKLNGFGFQSHPILISTVFDSADFGLIRMSP